MAQVKTGNTVVNISGDGRMLRLEINTIFAIEIRSDDHGRTTVALRDHCGKHGIWYFANNPLDSFGKLIAREYARCLQEPHLHLSLDSAANDAFARSS
jgi:hypothetical protein